MMLQQRFLAKAVLALAATLGTLRIALGLVAWRAANNLEQPQYTTLRRLPGNVELRQYDEYLVAEHTTPPTPAHRRFARRRVRRHGGLSGRRVRESRRVAVVAAMRNYRIDAHPTAFWPPFTPRGSRVTSHRRCEKLRP